MSATSPSLWNVSAGLNNPEAKRGTQRKKTKDGHLEFDVAGDQEIHINWT